MSRFDLLTDLAEFFDRLPVGTVIDEALKANIVGRIMAVGKGDPMASGGSRFDEVRARLTGPGGKYPPPPADFHPGPAGPAGPGSGPAPPAHGGGSER